MKYNEQQKEKLLKMANLNRGTVKKHEALKEKLNSIKEGELNFQRKKITNFHEEQAELISNRIIQQITKHFVNHLKDGESMEEGIEWIEKVFQLEQEKSFF